jgi:hypothetical protein
VVVFLGEKMASTSWREGIEAIVLPLFRKSLPAVHDDRMFSGCETNRVARPC